jgi:hypothetical protein
MKLTTLQTRLLAAGLARTDLRPLSPVQASGDYDCGDGFSVHVAWRGGGDPTVAPVAYHARWTEAYRAAESRLGPVYDAADEERVISAALAEVGA